jgi:hypothetical protein
MPWNAAMQFDHPAQNEESAFPGAFAAALLDPARATPDDIMVPRGKAAVRRYDVYRNNVTVSLTEALAAIYPAVQRITGVEFFRAMARLHIRVEPPTSPLLFEYGRQFPNFIESFDHARDLPWLADVARIERAWLDAYHAEDVQPLSPDALAAAPQERLGDLVFRVHPTTRIMRSPYPAATIFAMNRTDGPVASLQSDAAEDALITRPEMDVMVRHLPPGGASFLTCLIDGKTLAAATAAALAEAPSLDLAANIAGMLEAGVFTAVDIGD